MQERRSTKRAAQAAESRERIYIAALAVITEKGFAEASIQDIVAAAGASVGAFYHHFPSKMAVLEENFRRADARFVDIADGLPEDLSPKERVVAYMVRYGRFAQVEAGLDLCRQLYTPMNKLFIKPGRPMQGILREMLAEGLATGDIVSDLTPEQACQHIFIGARGLVLHWCLADGGFDLESAMEEYARRALLSLAPLGP